MRRVALFGASFDPPTGECGHGGIVNFLAHEFAEVWLVPVYQHPFLSKRARVQKTDFRLRIQMLKIQFGGLERVKISEAEKDFYGFRESQGLSGDALVFGTYDLIEFLRTQHPDVEFIFVVGGDTLLDICQGRWRRYREVMDMLPLLVISRKGTDLSSIDLHAFRAGVQLAQLDTLTNVSSTEVRNKLSQGEDVSTLIDPYVEEFIRQNALYGKL